MRGPSVAVLFVSAILISLLIVAGCGEDDDGVPKPDTIAPIIVSTVPADQSIDAYTDSSIVVVFSEIMDPSTIDTNTFKLYDVPMDCVSVFDGNLPAVTSLKESKLDSALSTLGWGQLPCSVSCDGNTATLMPLEELKHSIWHGAVVYSDVTDLAGNRLGQTRWWQFRTCSPDPFEIQIDKLDDVFQGHYAYVSINMNKGFEWFGGFDFLIAYDASALYFMGAELGWWLDGCYEYFTYRYSFDGDCGGPCPSGVLRVVGIADINNGDNHPDPYCLRHQGPSGDPYQMVSLAFYVTNDPAFNCMYLPIRFFWHDCGDNTISNIMGDTLFISRYAYDYEMVDITGTIHYGGHWWLGDCQSDDPEKPSAISFIDFIHGGIDIICEDSIDAHGDINANDIPNEIADAVLFTNFFIHGLGVFDIDPEGQIAASDCNNDGRVLMLGDLVYLIRIITGDALPYSKLCPLCDTAVVTIQQDTLSIESPIDVDVGACVFVFDGLADVRLLADGMRLKSDVVKNQTRVLIWSDSKNRIPAGRSQVLAVTGVAPLVEAQVSDYYGNDMVVEIK